MKEIQNIACIIVLYKPNEELLNEVIDSIIDQVQEVVLVNNSSEIKFLHSNRKIIYIELEKNMGIAHAQNIGINHLRNKDYEYVIMLDQDSTVQKNLVDSLISKMINIEKQNIKIAAISALPINKDTKIPYSFKKIENFQLDKHIIEVRELMNSSSLFKLKYFDIVGFFNEDLFIDMVDFEWCWRASSLYKLKFYISTDDTINHKIGEGDRFIVYKRVSIPTPFRTFFQYRNFFILTRFKYVPLGWKLKNLFKYIIKYVYYPLFVKPRLQYFKNINKGIISGLRN